MPISIALAGNPNSGKTTMFNSLTGSSQYVGNWPGVTVEKKEGKLKGNKEVIIQDLPGIYSLSPYTLEEVVSRNYLVGEKPDVILNIVDATNIERNLYLTTQLTEIGVPVVIALNMMDIIRKNGDTIDIKKLESELGCPIIETSALKGDGSRQAAEKAISLAQSGAVSAPKHSFSTDVEHALSQIQALVGDKIGAAPRWYAIKLFERDKEVLKDLTLSGDVTEKVEAIIAACEETLDDDSESIITSERYDYITGAVSTSVKMKRRGQLTTSDKIDQVVTNRILALPIFVVIMFLVYFISISTIGTAMTDWVNENFFEDGWHVLGIGAGDFEEAMEEFEAQQEMIGAFLEEAEALGIPEAGDVANMLEAEPEAYGGAFAYEAQLEATLEGVLSYPEVQSLVAEAEILDEDHQLIETRSVTVADFEAAMEFEEPDPTAFGPFVPGLMEAAQEGLESIGTADWLTSLIVDGIIAGVGAVLGFLPQMLVLFLCLAILEDCGYMARIAFIMDRIFRRFGLSGKSFIPILIGTGCAVPGIMASRTIENESDRRMTVITTSFIPCGAKLPIISLIAGALFGGSAWVATSAYFLGVLAIVLSGVILKKTKSFAGDPAPFVMELPAYHLPGVKGVLIHMWDRGKAFVKKAGTIILLATVLVWFLSSFSWSMEMVDTDKSILAGIGGLMAPLFAPLGWADWRAAVATVTGLIAKENVVGTFGVLFGFGEVMEDGYEIWGTLQSSFTQLAAYSFLVFNLLCAPCFAAIGAVRREMMSAKWTWFAIGYQTGLAYVVSLVIYQLGMLFTGNGFGVWTAVAFLLVIGFFYLLLRKPRTGGKLETKTPVPQGAGR